MMQEENKRPDEELDSSIDAEALAAFENVAEIPQKKKQPRKKRLTSNARLLISVTAIVAALAVLLTLLLLPKKGQTSTPGDTTQPSATTTTTTVQNTQVHTIFDRSKDVTNQAIVQKITIRNPDDTYSFRYNKTDKVYRLVGYDDIALSSSGMTGLSECLTTLNGYDKVKNVEKLSDFGLDKPKTSVDITYHDGSVATIYVGNLTPDEAGHYVCMKDSQDVYMVSVDTISYFQLKRGQFVERILLSAPTAKKDDTNGNAVLKELTLKGGPNNETLSIRQAAASDGDEYAYSTFIITKPYKRMVSETVSASLSGFTNLYSSEAVVLHPTTADKTKYGFDKPYATLDITLAVQTSSEDSTADSDTVEFIYYNEVSAKVTVGSKDANGNYYVMIDDHNVIYLVASSVMSVAVERTYVNTISELLFLKNITELKTVSITMNGKVYHFNLAHDETKENVDKQLIVTCDGKILSTPNFRKLYSKMMGIYRYGETDKAPSGDPLYRIVLIENNGSTFLSLDVFANSASLYTIRTTEGELFTVKQSDFNHYIQQVNNFLEGKAVSDI